MEQKSHWETLYKQKRPRHGHFFVYMVRCRDGTYYSGSTNNLEARIKLHDAGHGAKYVRGKAPVKLVYAKGYRYYKRALQAEAQLKRLTRGEKETLVRRYERGRVTRYREWFLP